MVLVVVLVVISLVVALKLSLASFPKSQVLGVGGAVAAAVAALLLLFFVLRWQVNKDTQEGREQDQPDPPKYLRYQATISVVTVFFAAVLGFGLNNLLDQHKWLFFVVATFIFLRFLTASANHLWLEYLKYERPYQYLDNVLVLVSFTWLTIFGFFGAYLCYAGSPEKFFVRAFYLLFAAFVASVIQVVWSWFRWTVNRWRLCRLTPPIGQGALAWLVVNALQLAAVVILAGVPDSPLLADVSDSPLLAGVPDLSWGTRLLWLVFVSALILICDFSWQLFQLARKPPQGWSAVASRPR